NSLLRSSLDVSESSADANLESNCVLQFFLDWNGARLASNVTPLTSLEIFGRLFESSEFQQLESEIKTGRRAVVVSGLAGSARALVVTALEKKLGGRVIFVARANREGKGFHP